MKVYFDNAATTPLDEDVLNVMAEVMGSKYGNPSSIHSHGREAKALVEKARKTVANFLNTSPSEIFFNSGGTEADNTAIRQAIEGYEIKHIITSPLEHHAVMHSIEDLQRKRNIKVSHVSINEKGIISLDDLKKLLEENERSLVSLMHANNEIGNILDINEVSLICSYYDAIFHSDTVQSICHYPINLQELKVHYITASAHKFHGPKGTGFLYINHSMPLPPLILGGSQERNMRGGTENVAGIVGLAKAMEIAHNSMKEDSEHIQGLKDYMIDKLQKEIPEVTFNGDYKGNSLYTVLNVTLPETDDAEMMLMKLDINGISASAGSACSSGSNSGSHVIVALGIDTASKPVIRFSFSKYNTTQEIDFCVKTLKSFYKVEV